MDEFQRMSMYGLGAGYTVDEAANPMAFGASGRALAPTHPAHSHVQHVDAAHLGHLQRPPQHPDFYFPPPHPPPLPLPPSYSTYYQPALSAVDADFYHHVSPSHHSTPTDYSPVNDAPLDSVAFPPPQQYGPPPLNTNFDPHSQPFMPSRPEKGFFTTSHSHSHSLDKDRYATPILPSDFHHKPEPHPFQTRPILGKRHASDAFSSATKSVINKRLRLESEDARDLREYDPLPAPEDMPLIEDDNPGVKPPYSYAELIANAILRAPGRRLTLNGIYTWIQNTFSFYKESEGAWTNSIRHNLSLNKAFSKRERPKDDPGKGSYWVVEDGMGHQFLHNKRARRPGQDTFTSSDAPRPSSRAGPQLGHARNSSGAGQMPPADALVHKLKRSERDFHLGQEHDISSDATLPASETVQPEVRQDGPAPLRSSSPPSDLRSSPPMPAYRAEASPRLPHGRRERDKAVESFRDSGFYSSIESSVPRVAANPLHLTSDADQRGTSHKHSRKRSSRGGRAEDEIARMRGSSFDPSPTKPKSVFKQPFKPASALVSSPSRTRERLALDPLTPGVEMLKQNTKLQSTVSPNTHLRRHRQEVQDLIGTPVVLNAFQDDTLKFSPAFNIGSVGPLGISPLKFGDLPNQSPSKIMSTELLDEFDVFTRKPSPQKRVGPPSSLTRPSLSRSLTSGVIESSTRSHFRLASPIRIMPPDDSNSPGGLESPIKRSTGSPSHTFDAKDFWGGNSSSDIDDDEGFDLSKGFSSIGASFPKPSPTASAEKENTPLPTAKNKPSAKSGRPPLGRSSTNVF